MSNPSCDYHPLRNAVDKCHSCQKLICLQDKQVLQNSTSSFFTRSSSIYCPICYYDKIKSQATPFSKNLALGISFIIFIFFGGFVFLFNFVLGVNSEFLTYFFSIFIGLTISIIWVVYFIVNQLSSSKYNLDTAKQHRDTLVDDQSINKEIIEDRSNREAIVYCMNCGTETESNKKYCPNCGDELHPVK